MRTLFQKTISWFLVTTILASVLFFALPRYSRAWDDGDTSVSSGDTSGISSVDMSGANTSGEDITSTAEGGEQTVADTPSDAGSAAVGGKGAGGSTNTGDVLAQCGAKAAQDWLLDKVIGMGVDASNFLSVPSGTGIGQAQTVRGTVQGCIKSILNTVGKTAFVKFKKRLLDKLTDDTVGWISGKGGKPKFITDFNSVLRNTADAALGDTIQSLGAGKLCNTKLSLQLRLNLTDTNKKFSDNVSCTLSQVVKNIGAFGNNFQNGSWIAYQELNGLQNNKYGLQLLAFDELARNQSAKKDALKTETAGTNGFLSTKMCVKWSVLGKPQQEDGTLGPEIVLGTFLAGNDSNLIDPNKPPKVPPANAKTKIENDYPASTITKLVCKPEDQQITTPGQTLATILGNSFQNDPTALVNATDLTPYLSKIFDAAINRLAKEGVRGLSRGSQQIFSDTTRGSSGTAYPKGTGPGYINPLGTSTISQVGGSINRNLASTTAKLAVATAKLNTLLKLSADISGVLSPLIDCQTKRLGTACTPTSAQSASLKQVTDGLAQTSTTLSAIKSSYDTVAGTPSNPRLGLIDLAMTVADVQTINQSLGVVLTNLAIYETQLGTFDQTTLSAELLRCNVALANPSALYACPL